MASKLSTARAAFERANLEAARIIAADPVKYPPDSLLGEWASLVLDRDDSGGIRRGQPGVRGLDRPVRFTALGETGNAEEYHEAYQGCSPLAIRGLDED